MSHTTNLGHEAVREMRRSAESLVVRARAGDQNAIAMIMEVRNAVPRSRRAAAAYDMLLDYVKKNPVGSSAKFGAESDLGRTYWLVSEAVKNVETYEKLPELVEMVPTVVDRYEELANLVADGVPVDPERIKSVVRALRGDLFVAGGKSMTFEAARKAGKKVAVEWDVRMVEGDLSLKPIGGLAVGFSGAHGAVPSHVLFSSAFKTAGKVEDVLAVAGPWDGEARQPIRVGFVLGLARKLQQLRKGGPIGVFSDIAAWELGE